MDTNPPVVSITTPDKSQPQSDLTVVGGTVQDFGSFGFPGSGIDRIELTIQRESDGKFWDPTAKQWVTVTTGPAPVLLADVLNTSSGTWLVDNGLPTGSDLINDIYVFVATAFDKQGKMIEGLTNDRVASAPMPSRETSLVVALAMGDKKLPGIIAALNRRLVNGLITDERTADLLLQKR